MSKIQFSVQVRLTADLERSKTYYELVLGCEVNDFWAVRDDFRLGFKLMQASKKEDVVPNVAGQNQVIPWDTYAYVETHQELDELYEDLKSREAVIVQEPSTTQQDFGLWKEFAISDPDGYTIAFGSGKRD
ncbi:VOC family protein [Paenibacillus sp. Marseille-Q4541]|uniref:VOC family protein n=1 Tax=Paenibacillus sp. Marseille-Q4541 TaxID=2831522 RepID=UPI001BA737CC|nr:VOC family protein [Paenibacillus sp. Marseille-Q4541]